MQHEDIYIVRYIACNIKFITLYLTCNCIPRVELFSVSATDRGNIIRGNTLIPTHNQSLYTCENGEVITQLAVCDTYNDCSDKYDENHCSKNI